LPPELPLPLPLAGGVRVADLEAERGAGLMSPPGLRVALEPERELGRCAAGETGAATAAAALASNLADKAAVTAAAPEEVPVRL